MGARRVARECALQLMYQWDLRRDDPDELARTYWEVHKHPESIREFADRLFAGTIGRLDVIDPLIQRHAHRWRLERMETVDRNVLRIAIGEMLDPGDSPPAVVIDEAIEIARRFSRPESAPFINGLLDSIRKEFEDGTGETGR
jgi:N utilization substance protein B